MKLKIAFISAIFGLISNVNAATVGFAPDTLMAKPGDTFSIDIVGSNFDMVLDGGGLNMQFDPTVVAVTGVTIDSTVWDPSLSGINGNIDNSVGNISGIFFNSFVDRTGDFRIATIDFLAKDPGLAQLVLSEFDMNPFASGGQVTPVDFVPGDVQVVPLPGAAWLMISGLGFLASRRRKAA